MVAKQLGDPKPLVQVACQLGFGDLGVATLKDLAEYLGIDYGSLSVASLLTLLAKKIIPGCTDATVLRILTARQVSLESDESVGDLLHLEWITDVFDRSQAEELSNEIKSARQHKLDLAEFSKEVAKFRVSMGHAGLPTRVVSQSHCL